MFALYNGQIMLVDGGRCELVESFASTAEVPMKKYMSMIMCIASL